ncbi:uncharacterized protein LOC110849403 isoform X2 [Folsomia candida]|nr:uncharacterized protein LOC110849403 isoform X2 [Folsomia candida]XP_035707432.1 uncharacterized protein LOC110849403 isoform X2 [Folsomia candida]XP_035707433.1 uncharacterized protein LOC110849403 isoform X2 [Folsomia candida]
MCTNPNCPNKYVGPIYIGQGGEGKATIQSRMDGHIRRFDSPDAAGIDGHFVGACKTFMRFVFMKQISDLQNRKIKETQYMHRFGTLDRLRGMNGHVSVSSLPSQTIAAERGECVSVRQTHKLVMSRKNRKGTQKVPTVHFQTLVAACIKANDLTSVTIIDIVDFIQTNYPHYYSKSTNVQNSFSNRLRENINGRVKETSSYYSNWFDSLEKDKDCKKPSRYVLKNDNFDEKIYEEGLKALDDFEKSEQERDSASSSTTPSPRPVRPTYVADSDPDSD